ncbi:hypothetical protein N9O16_04480 [Candidatus Poseidoniaceae archaeon]|nr:hypothetical protein [Candidatus Poseidoniaceae archaeon]
MGQDVSLGHQFTMQIMPFLMLVGAVMSLGASFWLPPLLLISIVAAMLLYWCYCMKHLRFEWADLRFGIVPLVILGAGFLTVYHLVPSFYDQAYHLQISNRILDRWAWEPTHQGMSYSFRPEIVSGIAAVELWLTGKTSHVFFVPTLILTSAAWSLQHLGEHFSDKRIGFLAGAVFCMLPVTVIFGRTMLLDIAVAGMIVTVFHHLHLTANTQRNELVLLGVLAAVVGLTKYPYLYLGGWIIVVGVAQKKYEQSKYIACGYFSVLGMFLIKNQIHTGWVLGPLQSQVQGTIASANSIATQSAVYTPNVFLTEFIEHWPLVLLCVALYGTALLIKRDRDFMFNYWLLILPAVFLHGFIIDFGVPRYSTPWLALLCVGIPAAILHSNEEFGEHVRRWNIPSVLIGILVLTSVSPLLQIIDEYEPSSEYLLDVRDGWSNIYREVGEELNESAIVVTGVDITMGLYSETPCYRYEDPEYSMLQAINKFDATHVFTQDSQYRYDIDVNSTFLFGSPIEPVEVFTSNEFTGRLWSVDQSRLEQSDWWRNSTVQINGSGAHYGDFVWLEASSDFEMLESTAIVRILELDSTLELDAAFDILAVSPEDLLCDSLESCSSFSRGEHLGQNWAVWMTNADL